MKIDIQRPSRNSSKPKIVIHSWDVWDMHSTLAQIIFPMLKKLKESKSGVPGPFLKDYDENRSEEENDLVFEKGKKEWDEVLDKISWSMEEIANNNKKEPDLPIPLAQKKMSRTQRLNRVFETVPATREDGSIIPGLLQQKHIDEIDPKELEEWRTKHKEYEERLQEGLNLFGKYFQNLWC